MKRTRYISYSIYTDDLVELVYEHKLYGTVSRTFKTSIVHNEYVWELIDGANWIKTHEYLLNYGPELFRSRDEVLVTIIRREFDKAVRAEFI